jgi:chaperonin cofactor prefoldin
MMSDPSSSKLWKGKEMAEKLRNRLQESYEAYQSTIASIERITKKIASKLDLDRAAELSRNDLEAILAANPKKGNDRFEIGKRIRFGMNRKGIKALLEELDDCNKELERFTAKSEKIETYHKTVKPAFAARLKRVQSYAKSLHGSLLWCCSCKASHKTTLQLEPRGNLFVTGANKSTSKTSFTVTFQTTIGDKDAPWIMQAAQIQVMEDDDDDTSSVAVSSQKPRYVKLSHYDLL